MIEMLTLLILLSACEVHASSSKMREFLTDVEDLHKQLEKVDSNTQELQVSLHKITSLFQLKKKLKKLKKCGCLALLYYLNISGQEYKIGPLCECVYLLVMTEPFDVWALIEHLYSMNFYEVREFFFNDL